MFEWQQTFQGFTMAVSLEWKHWSWSSLPHPSKFTTFDHRKETVDGFYFTWQRWSIPAPSNGWCLNPKGLFNGTLSHPFGTPWRVQVEFFQCFSIRLYDPRFPAAWAPCRWREPTWCPLENLFDLTLSPKKVARVCAVCSVSFYSKMLYTVHIISYYCI